MPLHFLKKCWKCTLNRILYHAFYLDVILGTQYKPLNLKENSGTSKWNELDCSWRETCLTATWGVDENITDTQNFSALA